MGQIHELVAQHGRDTARKLVPFEEKRLVDLAADVLADEKVAAGFTYSGFCMASLPHRSLPDNSEWVRKSDDFSLIIEPGKLFRHGEEEGTLYGVPFGPRARVILLYLQSEAIKTNSREIELGSSMRQWLDRMGIERGGKTYRAFRDQAARISACRLTFAFKKHGREGFIRDSIVDGGPFGHGGLSADSLGIGGAIQYGRGLSSVFAAASVAGGISLSALPEPRRLACDARPDRLRPLSLPSVGHCGNDLSGHA